MNHHPSNSSNLQNLPQAAEEQEKISEEMRQSAESYQKLKEQEQAEQDL